MSLFRTKYDAELKIWSGPKTAPLYSKQVTLGQILIAALERCPKQIGQICHDDGSQMTNGEIRINSIRASLNYRDRIGLKVGDVIGVIAKNSKNLASMVIGAFLNGTPISPLDPCMDTKDIVHMFAITKPKIVLCDSENVETVKLAMKELENCAPVFVFGQAGNGNRSMEKLMRPHLDEECYEPMTVEDNSQLSVVIICSSGTTGPSKGVSLSHAAVTYQIMQSIAQSTNCQDRYFCYSSLYWISGFMSVITTTHFNLIRVITTQKFSSGLLLDIIRKNRIQILLTPPSQMALLLNDPNLKASDLESLLFYYCGGSHVPQEMSAAMSKLLVNGIVIVGYGLSEVAGIIAMTDAKEKYSTGQLGFGVKIKILDEAGMSLDVNQRGEISIKTTYPFLGYYGNKEASLNCMDEEGWIRTGDIGFVDDDCDLHVVDRMKDILKYNNYQVNPSEIEALLQKLKDVIMVAVVGIPHPISTDLPAALIVRKANSNLTEDEVHKFIQANSNQNKWLHGGVFFFDSLPMTPSGKILKRQCKALVT